MKNIREQLSAICHNSFVRSSTVLVGGTATAQALTILALPILTRLYSPDEFSILAVYSALLTMITVVACLRLEIAIPLPEDETEAVNLLALALGFASATALLLSCLVFTVSSTFFTLLGQPQLEAYGWLLPVGAFLGSSYAATQAWSTRKKRFPSVARTRILQASSGLTAQLGLGLAGIGPLGLMLGHALMAAVGVVNLARQTWCSDRSAIRRISRRGMVQTLSKYRRFPQYSTFEALANNAAMQVPILLIAALAIGPEAGLVMLAMRALGTPVDLVGGAIAQVYLSRAPEEMREGRLSHFTVGLLRGLARVAVAPLVFIAVIAPDVFAIIFGEEWRRSGELVIWMTPWFAMKLLSSPVSMIMHIKMMQRSMLVLMLLGFALRVFMTLGAYSIEPSYIVQGYALSGLVFYAATFKVYLKASEADVSTLKEMILSAFVPIAVAAGAGLLCKIILFL
jgi:O-antigen/teichoic acid export membrane protein